MDADGGTEIVRAAAFVVTGASPYLVPAGGARSLSATAAVIVRARGRSGPNIEYFVSLLRCMRARGVRDAYLEALLAAVRAAAATHAATAALERQLAEEFGS